MQDAERHLLFVHTFGCQDVRDFEKIGGYVRDIDRSINYFIANNESRSVLTRKAAGRKPTLIFSPGVLIDFRPARGKLYAGRFIPKIQQMDGLRQAGLPVPHYAELTETTDLSQFGDLVLVKGSSIHASLGRGIGLYRKAHVTWRSAAEYPEDHPGRHGPMFVQEFIDTGEYPSHYRVLTLFGEPLLAYRNISTSPRCGLDAPHEALGSTIIRATRRTGQRKELINDPDVLALARKTYCAFPDVPLQACDIIRDVSTGDLYLLEVNPGGNTWAFSRRRTPEVLKELGVLDLTFQFDAFRTAARVLAERTNAEAE